MILDFHLRTKASFRKRAQAALPSIETFDPENFQLIIEPFNQISVPEEGDRTSKPTLTGHTDPPNCLHLIGQLAN